MARHKLARAAEKDFENIFGFGIDTIGLDQALSYQNGMRQRFEKLVEQPNIYPAVDHIRAGYRRSVCGSHSIYYLIESQDIVIVRILGQQDLTDALS